ncbi:LuxR C-terminal-related transcriptional regulator [Streptomyces sp. Je 1-369]|uniref:LuxR C-terminal-related transcriptional regulator n=1 Tax=Streptomyces sp. Je 1-369 TaxID=2966192 RepID=UPI0039E12DEF
MAEELFISPKTASVHVSDILPKLNASGSGGGSPAGSAGRVRQQRRLEPVSSPHPPGRRRP